MHTTKLDICGEGWVSNQQSTVDLHAGRVRGDALKSNGAFVVHLISRAVDDFLQATVITQKIFCSNSQKIRLVEVGEMVEVPGNILDK